MKNEIDSKIENLKKTGWKDEQIDSALQALTVSKPETIKTNFSNLIYFFSILPLNENAVNNSDLVDVTSAFTPHEFKEFLSFVQELQSSL